MILFSLRLILPNDSFHMVCFGIPESILLLAASLLLTLIVVLYVFDIGIDFILVEDQITIRTGSTSNISLLKYVLIPYLVISHVRLFFSSIMGIDVLICMITLAVLMVSFCVMKKKNYLIVEYVLFFLLMLIKVAFTYLG